MSAYTQFCSALLFPLHERIKGHSSVALRRELERSQWQSGEQIRQQQIVRLRDFLVQVQKNVPYYRDLFRELNFRPDDVDSIAALRRLPLLSKELIRANAAALTSRAAEKLIRYSTGGSSGEPLQFFMGLGRVDHDVAAKWRATRWWGVDIGDTEVVLWGSPLELGAQDRIKAWRDQLLRTHLLPAFQMSGTQMDGYIQKIRALRPKMIFGYASAIALLARHAESSGESLSNLGVIVAFTTGETLFPDQRSVIERVFDAPVANGYGSRDAGFIAHQCELGSLHISAEHIIVEILDSSGAPVRAGERGEIVTTHMATADFPFIRYRTGDMAVAEDKQCACGRGLPVLREVFGRSTDFIRTPSGEVMHALALIYEVREKPGVRAFKFIQSQDLSLELLLVADERCTAAVENQIRAGLLARLGEASVLAIRRVSDIPPEKSGKYRYVVSHARPA